jgi:hypothetical protein
MALMGTGFFSSQIGGMKATALMLLGHIVYGGFLGLFPTLVQEDFLRWNRLRVEKTSKAERISVPAASASQGHAHMLRPPDRQALRSDRSLYRQLTGVDLKPSMSVSLLAPLTKTPYPEGA